MSSKLPPWWERRAAKDFRGQTERSRIKKFHNRHTRREGRAEAKEQLLEIKGKDDRQRRLELVAHKAIGIHADYAEAVLFNEMVSPDGYGIGYLSHKEDEAVEKLAAKYGFTFDEVEREVQRICNDSPFDTTEFPQ